MKKIILGLGIVACTGALGLTGCALKKASKEYTLADYEKKEYSIPINELSKLFVNVENSDLSIKASADDQVRIIYYDMEYEYYTISNENGILEMSYTIDTSSLKKQGLAYSLPEKEVTIEIPGNINIPLDIITADGVIDMAGITTTEAIVVKNDSEDIRISDINASELTVDTTYAEVAVSDIAAGTLLQINGVDTDVTAKNLAAGQIKIDTTNGDIKMDQIQGGAVHCIGKDTAIEFTALESEDINLVTSNGDIEGQIAGASSDYTVVSSVKEGENNLKDHKGAGSKKLNVENKNADINISFTEG